MAFNPDIHHRRSMRLRGYDYSQAGAYFITICTQNRKYMFGEITDGKMIPNPAGNMVQTVWDEIPLFYTGIEIDAFAVMPNHIHGIIVIPAIPGTRPVGAGPRACPPFRAPCDTPRDNEPGQPRGGCPYEEYGNRRKHGNVIIGGWGASV